MCRSCRDAPRTVRGYSVAYMEPKDKQMKKELTTSQKKHFFTSRPGEPVPCNHSVEGRSAPQSERLTPIEGFQHDIPHRECPEFQGQQVAC